LSKIKHIIKFGAMVAYHLRLEVAYYNDRYAQLPLALDEAIYDDDSDDDVFVAQKISQSAPSFVSSHSNDLERSSFLTGNKAHSTSTSGSNSTSTSGGSSSNAATNNQLLASLLAIDESLPEIFRSRKLRYLLSTSLDVDFNLPSKLGLRGLLDLSLGMNVNLKSLQKRISPEYFQSIFAVSILMSQNDKSQKSKSDLTPYQFYSQYDITLGRFLMERCFHLSSRNKDTSIVDHTLSLVHRTGRLDIEVKQSSAQSEYLLNDSTVSSSGGNSSGNSGNSSGNSSGGGGGGGGNSGFNDNSDPASNELLYLPIYMSSQCSECNVYVTPYQLMSDETWKMSFGKFLEIFFYNRSARCRTGECNHIIRDSHVLYFICDVYEARLQFHPVHSYALHIRKGLPFNAAPHNAANVAFIKQLLSDSNVLFDDFRRIMKVLKGFYFVFIIQYM
jgi:hypothetical protein